MKTELCSLFEKSEIPEIPKILHMVWVGEKEPPQYFWDNLNGWKALMPNWTFMVWTNETITEQGMPKQFLDLLKRCRNGAQMADLLGYFAIERYGGYLMDADVIPIRSLDELDTQGKDVILCHDLPEITWNYISTGFFGAVPHHQLFKNLVNTSYQIDLTDPAIQLTTGPGHMGKEWFKIDWFKNGGYLMLPYWAFYRNRIGDPGPYMPDRIMRDHPDAFGNHFYAASWM